MTFGVHRMIHRKKGGCVNARYSLAFLAVVLSSQATAAGSSADDVGRAVRKEMERQHIPGLALLVSRNG